MEWRDVFGLIGVAIGFGLAQLPPLWNRKRRLLAQWSAMRAEMRMCDDSIEHLLNHGIPAPLYRLPVDAFRHSYPVLLAEGDVSEQDVLALGRYIGWVHDINRGLDIATEANKKDDKTDVWNEHRATLRQRVALKL